jgi:prevent-host-death family protein
MAMTRSRRVSVADAKNNLPALLHETEDHPVTIERRGTPVAVLVSADEYDRLTQPRRGLGQAIAAFRSAQRGDVDVDGFLDSISRTTRGRRAPW